MASVHRDLSYRNGKPRSPYWYACFTGSNGRRLKKSTKCTDEKTAQKIADAWEEAARKAREGHFIEEQARTVLNEILSEAGQDQMPQVTVRTHFGDVIQSKERSVAPRTMEKYHRVARDFLASLGPKADKRIDLVRPRDVQLFLEEELGGGRSAATVNQSLKVVRMFFERARRLGLISNSPADPIDEIRGNATTRETFTTEQILQLLQVADDEWKGMILLGVYCGMRIGDASTLRWSNVDLKSGILTYSPGKSGGRQNLKVPVAGELRDYLEARIPDDPQSTGPVFPRLSQTRVNSRNGLSQTFLSLVREIGIDPYQGQKKLVSDSGGKQVGRRTALYCFHSLRHGFVSALAAANVPEEIRCLLTGHKSKTIHAQYTHHELDTLQRAVALLPRIEQ